MRKFLHRMLVVPAILAAGCGGGGGGGSTAPSVFTPAANELTVVVDGGPNINQPFVSITLCAPGSTTSCQTIDHVLLDTGSTGLRVVAEVIDPVILAAFPARQNGGNDLLECQAFISGYTWGTVKLADVKLGALAASNLAIHVIGDADAGAAPNDCSSRGSGNPMNTVATLGAKGVLGIDAFVTDCPACALAATVPAYFTCPGGTCTTVQVATADQVRNPVAELPTDNNGILLAMPAVPATGATNVTGSLFLGVGTRNNNGLGAAAVFDLDSYGEYWTRYNGQRVYAFADSGSNGLFFPDAGITVCDNTTNAPGFFCPGTTLSPMSALVEGATNQNQTTVNFSVADAHTLVTSYPNTAYSNLAGPWTFLVTPYFDWGMPFFYGRSVFYAIEGRSTPNGTGPYVAF